MIEALVFDFDGVIIDTEIPSYETWQEVYAAHTTPIWIAPSGSARSAAGTHTFDAIRHLEAANRGAQLDREAVRKSRKERHDALVRSTPLLPGVLEYIQEARRLGLKLGVASSSSHAWVEGHLADRGLLSLFQSVAAREDVAHIKPDPALYLVALQRLGVPPDRAVAIEDSLNGLTAAKRAGMFCVAVPNPMTGDLPLESADLRLGAPLRHAAANPAGHAHPTGPPYRPPRCGGGAAAFPPLSQRGKAGAGGFRRNDEPRCRLGSLRLVAATGRRG